MSNAVKVYQISRKVHKWAGLILSVVFMFLALTGLLIVFSTQLGLGSGVNTVEGNAEPSQTIPIDKVLSITSQEFSSVKSINDISRIELTASPHVYRVLANDQEVVMDASTGKILSNKPDYTTLLITMHDGSFFGNWYKFSAVAMAGLSLILLSFSGYYMVGFPLYKRLMARKKAKNSEIS
ncbi:PepSY-associated TM helix domain-containing protein [Peribacillus simplex]|uniref:PepSY-associated TM helix domain-containing protein n=2 Tax=Peribacillus TaxID=2675229 RepID=A0AA90P320_9BACI|nr:MULTISPECIES: PepSY-associated TM helix domain-containing protein [Peribacillus]MDP1419893.1 PepSY-associated TM helix domain-containing protein [Peribacillus simplex]MDP1452753.1 PepSY-associated TM helix domain-containing protein [Peribacillus frigoritolerans]